VIAQRVFCWFISGGADGADEGRDPAEEVEFSEKLLAAAEPNSPVMGWWGWGDPPVGIGEYFGMTLASRYAKTTIGTEFLSNMTFHSAIAAPATYRQGDLETTPPPLERDKVYVAISVLDSGNDPWYWLRPQREVWEAPGRGETPTGWVIGPALLDLAPGIVEWFYDHRTPRDELICALSGAGYMDVTDYGTAYADRDAVMREYLGQTRDYMRRLDLRTLETYHGSWGEPSDTSRDGDLAMYARRLPGLVALLPDIGRHDSTTPDGASYIIPGALGEGPVPVFHCLTRWIPWEYSQDVADRPEEPEIAGLVQEVRGHTPTQRPGFMSAFALSWTFRPEMVNEAAQRLGDDYRFVTPSQLAALYREAFADRGGAAAGASAR
jgi:hypothetical protein